MWKPRQLEEGATSAHTIHRQMSRCVCVRVRVCVSVFFRGFRNVVIVFCFGHLKEYALARRHMFSGFLCGPRYLDRECVQTS